jgi:Ca2+-binding RTX toxin-like protein
MINHRLSVSSEIPHHLWCLIQISHGRRDRSLTNETTEETEMPVPDYNHDHDEHDGYDNDDYHPDEKGYNIIKGDDGNNKLYGTHYDDLILARGGDDKVYAKDGDDYVFGQKGNDWLYGGDDDDHLYGGKGKDWLYGDDGKDTLYGNRGDDYLDGGKGRDVLYGGRGDDDLYGGRGDDDLYGGRGDDYLDGGRGDDDLYGGEGRDTFHFDKHSGHDTIHDFDKKKDYLDIDSGRYEVSYDYNKHTEDTTVSWGDNSVVLEDVYYVPHDHHIA